MNKFICLFFRQRCQNSWGAGMEAGGIFWCFLPKITTSQQPMMQSPKRPLSFGAAEALPKFPTSQQRMMQSLKRPLSFGAVEALPKFPIPQQGLWCWLVIVFVCWFWSWIGGGLTWWFTTGFWSAKCLLVFDCLFVWLEVGTGIGFDGVWLICWLFCVFVGWISSGVASGFTAWLAWCSLWFLS